MSGSQSWGRIGWCSFIGLVVAGAMWAGGVPLWRAIVVGSVSAAVLWAIVMSSITASPTWPSLPSASLLFRPTGSWQLPGLEAARHSPEAFADHVRPRLWADARDLLVRRGIPPESSRAIDLIGRREYAVLTGADTDPRHVTASLPALCDAIARLAVAHEPGGAPAIYHPALMGIASRPGRESPKGRAARKARESPTTRESPKSDRKERHA